MISETKDVRTVNVILQKKRLAIMEAVQIVASIVKNFRIELAYPDKETEEVADLTLGPKAGLYLKLTR